MFKHCSSLFPTALKLFSSWLRQIAVSWAINTLMIKNLVSTSQRTRCVPITKTSHLIFNREIIVVYCERHTEHKCTVWGKKFRVFSFLCVREFLKRQLLNSFCMSFFSHGTSRLQLDGFSWNFVLGSWGLLKICREYTILVKISETYQEDLCTFKTTFSTSAPWLSFTVIDNNKYKSIVTGNNFSYFFMQSAPFTIIQKVEI